MRFLYSFIIMLLSFSALAAEPEWPPEAKPARAFAMDRAKSHLSFRAVYAKSEIKGEFAKFRAKIHFDPENLRGSDVRVDVDMTAIRADSDTASTLAGKAWFASADYSNALFVSRDIRHIGGNEYEARGVLTIKGHSEPVTLPFTLTAYEKDSSGAAIRARIEGTLPLSRTLYGVGQGEWADGATVADEVNVEYAVEATPLSE